MGTNGAISGALNGGTNGTMNYAGYTSPVTFSLSGAAGTTTGVGGPRAGITSVTGSSNSDTITGSAATYNLTAQNAGTQWRLELGVVRKHQRPGRRHVQPGARV